jgi:hypothetical protein
VKPAFAARMSQSFPRLALIILFTLAACRREEGKPPPPMPADQLAAAIERVREVKKGKEDEPPSRLSGMAEGEVGARFKAPPLCRLTREDQLILVARGGEALVRADGKPTLLAFGGPVTPEGGFFTGPGLSVSVGRHAPVATPAEGPGIGWPVGVTVGGSPKLPPEKLDAVWTCEL